MHERELAPWTWLEETSMALTTAALEPKLAHLAEVADSRLADAHQVD